MLVAHLSQAGFTPQEMIDANVAVSRGRGQLADRFYDRVMFPIFDEQGHNIAFGGRIMGDGQPKYLNTAETSVFHKKRNLYGFNWAKEFIVAQDTAIVVEGYTDCIACWEAGIKTLSPRWAPRSRSITSRRSPALPSVSCICSMAMRGPEGRPSRDSIYRAGFDGPALRGAARRNDPMEFITAHGGQELQARIDAAEPLMDFVYRSLQESSDITTPGGRAKALEDALTLIYPLRDSYMIDTYFIQIADLLGLDLEAVRVSSGRVFRDVAKREDAERRREQNYERQRAQAERSGSAGGRTSGSQGHLAVLGHRARRRLCPRRSKKSRMTTSRSMLTAPRPWRSSTTCRRSTRLMVWVLYLRLMVRVLRLRRRRWFLLILSVSPWAGERELLTMLTSYPDLFRTYADRICSIEWVDPRHESIAWAVLATPPGTDPAACMDAARRSVPRRQRL